MTRKPESARQDQQRRPDVDPEGHVRLYRRILSSELWALPDVQTKVGLTMLLKANWKDRMVRGMWVKRGQWLTHHKDIQAHCSPRVSLQQVRRAEVALGKIGFSDTTTVRISGRQFLLVTVCNYDRWNPLPKAPDTTGDTTGDRQPTPNRQLTDTTITEEVKEVKEVEEFEKNRQGLVDNSEEDGTDRAEEIQSLVSDMAERKALGNIALVDRILEETGDRESQAYYERMVRAIDHMAIERMLGAVKEARNLGEIRKSPGALLKHLMKLELQSHKSQEVEA